MNPRERILALTVVTVAILVGGGVLFKFLFLDSLFAIYAQTAEATQELDKKNAELDKEAADRKTILSRDPRLAQWQRLSLPEDKNQEKELKKGQPLEEIRKRHEEERRRELRAIPQQFIDAQRLLAQYDQSHPGPRGS